MNKMSRHEANLISFRMKPINLLSHGVLSLAAAFFLGDDALVLVLCVNASLSLR